jgi:hypothetical protein
VSTNGYPFPVGVVGARVYSALEPMTTNDVLTSYSLLKYVTALALGMEDVATLAETDVDGEIGWSKIIDINRCPDEALPWLAQFIGVQVPPGQTPDVQRQRIRTTDGWNRGTVSAIAGAAAQYLAGTKQVTMRERFNPGVGADPYHLQIFTLTGETPNPTQVQNAIIRQKPAGIILHYSTMAGQDFQQLKDNHGPNFSNVYSTYATFQGVYQNVPGT